MSKKKKLNKTEESVFTLLSLYVLVNQNFEAITQNEDIMKSDFNMATATFKDVVTDTMLEALSYQILLKACAYLDEWNRIFGVHTEPEHKDTIVEIKRIAKPAFKCISEWKDLRTFRNELIAHNHRNKEGENIYLNYKPYHSPQTVTELYLLVFCLKRMTDVLTYYFHDVMAHVIYSNLNPYVKTGDPMPDAEIKARMIAIDKDISSLLPDNANFFAKPSK